MADVQDILSRLSKVKGAGRNAWSALCPAHEDKKPSLSVGVGDDGKVLLHCHAGCELGDIAAAIGLQESDLFPQQAASSTSPHVVDTYDYTDAEGKLLYQVLRKSDKTFVQRRPDGSGGWIWNMKNTPRVLYQLPDVLSSPKKDWVFVVEGEKDVDNLRACNLVATCNPGGAGKWHTVSDLSPLHDRRIAIIPDNDDAGRQHAHEVAESLHGKVKALKIVELPDLPPKGDVTDWLASFDREDDTGPSLGIRRLAEGVPGWEPVGSGLWQAESTWPEPRPIPDDLPPVKAFDSALLPETIRPWIVDIAERMQCPPDFPAVAAMLALSGLLGRKIAIRPKQKDNWTVIPNLWGMLIGRPSLMKSPPMKEAMRPIRRMTNEALAEYESKVSEHVANQEFYAVQIKLTKDKIAKALKNGEDTETLKAELRQYLQPEQPRRRRYTVNDTTVEALGQILAENPNGVILERDELMGFLKSLERAGQEGARAFFLEAWTGDGAFETDRIGRGNVRINGVCLGVIGTIQPGPLGLYLNQALHGGTGDDGLMQRFQLAVWPDDPGPWRVVDRWPDQDACAAAFEVYRRFDALQASAIGASPDPFGDSVIPFLRFGEDAQHRFFEWMTTRENHLRSGHEYPALESHLTKYRKLIPALALIIHLAEGNEGPIGLDALDRSIGWGDYLESHARRIYSCGIDPAVGHARALAKRLLAGDVKEDPFTARDVYRHHWSMLGDKEQVRIGAGLLADLDWLSEETMQPKGRGRRTTRYCVNPRIWGMAI